MTKATNFSGSKYSTPTVHWKRSAETAVVGFGGLAGGAFHLPVCYWPICFELYTISPCGKFAGADLSVAQVIFLSGSHLGGWRTANLEMLSHHQAISHNRRGARKHSLRGRCPVIQGTRVDRRECRELYILVFFLEFRVCRKSPWA
jgi:hypothetical protein